MKATSAYKMSKPSKMLLCQCTDSHQRGNLKRALIQAELSAAIRPKTRKERQEADDQA